jgi:hypothetical protein
MEGGTKETFWVSKLGESNRVNGKLKYCLILEIAESELLHGSRDSGAMGMSYLAMNNLQMYCFFQVSTTGEVVLCLELCTITILS